MSSAPRRPVSPDELQQHDLKPRVASAIVHRAQIDGRRLVVEIGPGRGNLTSALLGVGARVHAVELDPERCHMLHDRFSDALAGDQLQLVEGDVMRYHPQPDEPWQVVANPPFQLTANLLRGWLLGRWGAEPPQALDLVLQREAAGKLGGKRGAESRSSILVRLAGFPRLSANLFREDTTPASRVDLVHWAFERKGSVSVADLRAVDGLLEQAFAGHHTMNDALRGLATGVQIRRQSKEHGWDPNNHPRSLVPEAWVPLANLLVMCGKIKPVSFERSR